MLYMYIDNFLIFDKGYWWRRRESNPRPETPIDGFYMLSSFFNLPSFPKEQMERGKVLLIFEHDSESNCQFYPTFSHL